MNRAEPSRAWSKHIYVHAHKNEGVNLKGSFDDKRHGNTI